jgi:hypothetical protein
MTLSAPSAARAARTMLVRLLRSKLFTVSTSYISSSAALVALSCLVFMAGCGGGSGGGSSTPPNPAPSVTSLSPNSGAAGGAAFTVTVSGSNFISSSTVEWNGSSRQTTFASGTSLQAAITAADIATAGTASLTVSNPAPGGGTSSPLTFTINNPVPAVTSITPSALLAGSPAFALTLSGSNFSSTSTVQWNGSPRTTNFVSSTSLQSAISAADIATPGTASVTVTNPTPGGGTSAALTFTIQTPPPTITVMTPSSAIVGGAAFTVAISGSNFFPTSTVEWNGSARPTTFVSSSSLHASITATDISAIGAAKITVVNPLPMGGSSAPSMLFVGSSGGSNFAQIVSTQSAQDIAFDPVRNLFYLSVGATAATNPNSIAVLDPSTGAITSVVPVPAGSEPNLLAISDDAQFLYVGFDGTSSVQRYTLPALKPDVNIPLGTDPDFGPYFAVDLQVAPGAPHTIAVSRGVQNFAFIAEGGLVIFDDATPRPMKVPAGIGTGDLLDSFQWTSDATTIFAADTESGGANLFYKIPVTSAGASSAQIIGPVGSFGKRIHFDHASGRIYSDGGPIRDSSGTVNGIFDVSQPSDPYFTVMVPDPNLGAAFFAKNSVLTPAVGVQIDSFELAHLSLLDSIQLNDGVTGDPIRLLRWGQNGLALVTDSLGQVVLLGGDFVGPASSENLSPPPAPTIPPAPAPSAPAIAKLIPSSAIAGSAAFTINITGTNFDSHASVQFNGDVLPTTFVSSTQLTANVTAAQVATPGAARIAVLNPSTNGGSSATSSFLIGTTGGTSSAGSTFAINVINRPANDIVYDRLHQWIYLSVSGGVASVGNSISVFDPFSSTFVGAQFAGSQPNHLAISDDSQFLYVSLDGTYSVQQFTLPALAPGALYSLMGDQPTFGPFVALDLQVAPGAPHTTAVAIDANGSPSALGSLAIFDDASPRPVRTPPITNAGLFVFQGLQWGSDSTTLYAGNFTDSGQNFYTLSVTSDGVTLNQNFPSVVDGTPMHFDAVTKLIYTDAGRIIDPSAGTVVGSFASSGVAMVPDSGLNLAFFGKSNGGVLTIQSFNLTTHALVDTITIPNLSRDPIRLIRWGQNGLAFTTNDGNLYTVGGNFVH